MALYLEIISGPHKGEKYVFAEGSTIGRAKSTISLGKDPKLSGQHARVRLNSQGQLSLLDLDSSNGIRFQGQKVKKLVLMSGVEFILGSTLFKVGDEATTDEATRAEAIPLKEDWLAVLRSEYLKVQAPGTVISDLIPLSPNLRLTFLLGIEADRVIDLVYGPRSFGSDTLDIELEDPMTPPLAFQIVPSVDGPLFVTTLPKLVWVNGLSLTEKLLAPGDEISLGQTRILVEAVDV
jgi:pSer/pThr/pTyr-binding forkhead associated (FHA) protein